MTKLLYCNINKMMDAEIGTYLRVLPEFMKADITRYKFTSDQKSRLIARLMLHQSMQDTDGVDLIHTWKRDANNKPFIHGWNSFSITHSEEMVVFGYDRKAIGIDIEKMVELNYKDISEYFHPNEQEYILKSKNIQKTFYEIWVKKEAALKAIGTGIINGLKEINCIADSIIHQGKSWYFHSLDLHPGYTCYLCSSDPENKMILNKFNLQKN